MDFELRGIVLTLSILTTLKILQNNYDSHSTDEITESE